MLNGLKCLFNISTTPDILSLLLGSSNLKGDGRNYEENLIGPRWMRLIANLSVGKRAKPLIKSHRDTTLINDLLFEGRWKRKAVGLKRYQADFLEFDFSSRNSSPRPKEFSHDPANSSRIDNPKRKN